MMLYPPMAELVKKVGSRYLLVNLVARRAREISQKAEEEGESLDRKPISTAIDEVYTGKLTIKSMGVPEDEEQPETEPETEAEPKAEETEEQ
ncbi:MAG: DNA-directed RNA polymerase subunit omega [Candidatus Scatomorpha sp.]|jgi:DNA-directed RNA polymerase subunit omega